MRTEAMWSDRERLESVLRRLREVREDLGGILAALSEEPTAEQGAVSMLEEAREHLREVANRIAGRVTELESVSRAKSQT